MLVVLDSLGIGAAPDASRFGDAGADTLGHIACHCRTPLIEGGRGRDLTIPNLLALGLGHAAAQVSGRFPSGLHTPDAPRARWGAARERSSGKDTISGHWEMMGVPVLQEWGYFRQREQSFPPELLDALVREADLPGVLGNCHASGTEIIARLGEAHLASGKPIVYTSADSVLQIAAHEQGFGLQRLYDTCAIARRLVDAYRIGRVIARPFLGDALRGFQRTTHRRDYAVPPPAPTLLDDLLAAGGTVIGIGKIPDIFANRGISRAIQAYGLPDLVEATAQAFSTAADQSLVFTNLVDFDQDFGHRRDVAGYADALERFDTMLPRLTSLLGENDLLILTADHGNDPTWPGSDHTREHIPILATGPAIAPGDMGCRDSFADIGQSLATWFGLAPIAEGESFLLSAQSLPSERLAEPLALDGSRRPLARASRASMAPHHERSRRDGDA